MLKVGFKIPGEYAVLFKFLFWMAMGSGIFIILLRTSSWPSFDDGVGWVFARVVDKYDWRFLAEDPHILRLVFHVIPSVIQAVCTGGIAGVIVGYAIRSPVDVRAILAGCLLVFFVWNVYSVFYFMHVYENIAAAKDGDLIIKIFEMQGVKKSQAMGSMELTLSSMVEFLKINIVMLVSLLISVYSFRHVYFSQKRKSSLSE